MTQTLWRNCLGGQPTDWYNAGGGVPATFETAFTGTAPVGSPAAGASDMLSLVFHEMGHSLGMSSGIPLTVTETNDGDYDFNSAWLFGGTLAADNVDQADGLRRPYRRRQQLDVSEPVDPGSGGSAGVRKLPSHADLFAMAAGHQYTTLDVPRREFYNPNGDWNTECQLVRQQHARQRRRHLCPQRYDGDAFGVSGRGKSQRAGRRARLHANQHALRSELQRPSPARPAMFRKSPSTPTANWIPTFSTSTTTAASSSWARPACCSPKILTSPTAASCAATAPSISTARSAN